MPYLDNEINVSEGSIKILVLKVHIQGIQGIGDQSKRNYYVMEAYSTSTQVSFLSTAKRNYFFFFLIKMFRSWFWKERL